MIVEAQFSEGFLLLCHFSCQSNQMEEIITAGFRPNTMNYHMLYNTHGHVISDVSRGNSLWVIRNPYSNDSTCVDQVLYCVHILLLHLQFALINSHRATSADLLANLMTLCLLFHRMFSVLQKDWPANVRHPTLIGSYLPTRFSIFLPIQHTLPTSQDNGFLVEDVASLWTSTRFFNFCFCY